MVSLQGHLWIDKHWQIDQQKSQKEAKRPAGFYDVAHPRIVERQEIPN
jgi:hypothetical protein